MRHPHLNENTDPDPTDNPETAMRKSFRKILAREMMSGGVITNNGWNEIKQAIATYNAAMESSKQGPETHTN